MPEVRWYGKRYNLTYYDPPARAGSVLVTPDIFGPRFGPYNRQAAMNLFAAKQDVRFLLPTRYWAEFKAWWQRDGWQWSHEVPKNLWLGVSVRGVGELEDASESLLGTVPSVWVHYRPDKPLERPLDLERWYREECPVHLSRTCGCGGMARVRLIVFRQSDLQRFSPERIQKMLRDLRGGGILTVVETMMGIPVEGTSVLA